MTVVRPVNLGCPKRRCKPKFQQSSLVLNRSPSLTFAQDLGGFRPSVRAGAVEELDQSKAFLPLGFASRKFYVSIGNLIKEFHVFIDSGKPIGAWAVARKSHLWGWRFLHVLVEQDSLVPYPYDATIAQCPITNLTEGYRCYSISNRRQSTKRIAEKWRCLARPFGVVSLQWSSSHADGPYKIIERRPTKRGGTHCCQLDLADGSYTLARGAVWISPVREGAWRLDRQFSPCLPASDFKKINSRCTVLESVS
jgi:hypothetical protein